MSIIIAHNPVFQAGGWILTVLISFIGIRMLFYWASFTLHPGRYRARKPVSTDELRRMMVPFVKVQITTKGSPGSSEVILRSLRQLQELATEDPDFYAEFLSAEVVTENREQADFIRDAFADSHIKLDCVATPRMYRTLKGTELKAKQMHYLVELRRSGWNMKPGKTFIVHWDEDTLMMPDEFRKMVAHLATTDKSILTGPIYYPLEYGVASRLARATEASRPITCFECRRVMETGEILHIHGSNLVVEEELENRIGWDIGNLNGVPFVAEDYMFGMDAFIREGSDVFGWHGCVALEQPPFSFPSVDRQRYRWVFGVLQGMSADTHLADFAKLSWRLRMKIIWGTRYRIATYALGTIVGALSLLYIPLALIVSFPDVIHGRPTGIPWELTAWFALIGIMWLGSSVVGAWTNTLHAGYTSLKRLGEIAIAVCIAPVAGMMENMAALKAVAHWVRGKREVVWHTTPSTKAADDMVNGKVQHTPVPLSQSVSEALAPWRRKLENMHWLPAAAALTTAAAIVSVYIGYPFIVAAQSFTHGLSVPLFAAAIGILLPLAIIVFVITWTAQSSTVPYVPRHTRNGMDELEAMLNANRLTPVLDEDNTDVMLPIGYYERDRS